MSNPIPNPFGGSVQTFAPPTQSRPIVASSLPMTSSLPVQPETKVMPDWMQQMFMRRIVSDLKEGKYVSAESMARNILAMKDVVMDPSLVQTCRYALDVLRSMNYTEESFLQNMNAYMEAKSECPLGSVQPDPKTGLCPEEYVPFQVKGKTCCQKVGKMLKQAEKHARGMREKLFSTAEDRNLLEAYDKKFLIGKEYDKQRASVKEMITANMPRHTQEFLEHTTEKDIEETTKVIKEELQKPGGGQAHVIAGFKNKSLFQKIMSAFEDVGDFVEWLILSDWSRLWYFAVLVKIILFAVCMYAKAKDATAFWDKLCEQMFGFKPLTVFFIGTWGPIVMASLIFQLLFRLISSSISDWGKTFAKGAAEAFKGKDSASTTSVLGMIANPLQAMFDFMQLGYIAHRLSIMLSFPSFVYDLATSIYDMFNAVKVGFMSMGDAGEWVDLQGVTRSATDGGLTKAWHMGVQALCGSQFDMFLRKIGKSLREVVFIVFQFICAGLTSFIPSAFMRELALTPCKSLVSFLETMTDYDKTFMKEATYNNILDRNLGNLFSGFTQVAGKMGPDGNASMGGT